MLMRYRCVGSRRDDGCGQGEMVWNSRDGVTPFIISCRFCGSEAKHIQWQQDVYLPNYEPPVGSRVFVDLDPEKALELAWQRVEQYWDHPEYPMRGRYSSKEEIAQILAKEYYDDGGQPHLIEVTPDVARWLSHT